MNPQWSGFSFLRGFSGFVWGGFVSRATVSNRRQRRVPRKPPVRNRLQDAILPHKDLE
jgi:hypothetical protein